MKGVGQSSLHLKDYGVGPGAAKCSTLPLLPALALDALAVIGDGKDPTDVFKDNSDVAHQVAFSPDGGMLATVTSDFRWVVKLWNVRTGRLIRALRAESAGARTLAFSPDGRKLAAGRDIWDVETGRILRTLEGTFSLESVAFSPDGRLLATAQHASSDGFATAIFRGGEVQRENASRRASR